MIRAILDLVHSLMPPSERPHGSTGALQVSTVQEEKLLDHLITEVWEQGCWLPSAVIKNALTPKDQIKLVEEYAGRKNMHREALFPDIPEKRRQDDLNPEDDIWILTSQRCDIIKSLQREPIVTCVRATKCTSKQARGKTNNGRHNTLYTVRDDGTSAWVADFRQVIFLPKSILIQHHARQCLPDGKARRDFAYNLSQRTWRRPVPPDMERKVGDPIRERLNKKGGAFDATWASFFNNLDSVLVDRNEESEKIIVYAILRAGLTDDIAEGKLFYDTVLPTLCPDTESWLDYDKSILIPVDQLLMTLVFNTYKLSLDSTSTDEESARSDF